MTSVAVIDLGSNSIKILVATRASGGGVEPLHLRTIDARISGGLGARNPRLGDAAMARGIEAVSSLLADAARFSPRRISVVATSAVRDAANGADFRARLRAATGHDVRLLDGAEEASLIGRGLTCDPALRQQQDFNVFDLGGGSLECLAFRRRQIEQAVSLQLGCVRLMERFVTNPAGPFPASAAVRISAEVAATVAAGGFRLSLPAGAVAVGTGGTITNVRTILGTREGIPFESTDPTISVGQLRALLQEIGGMTLAERKQLPGLPPARADVFPTALATFIALAEIGGYGAFQNSVFSLRFGVADEMLAENE